MPSSIKEVNMFDVDLTVHFDYTHFVPARISGPPEDCHPAEGGEVDVTSVYIGQWDVTELLSEKVVTLLEAHITENVPEMDSGDDHADFNEER
jgi:hypothetical protein